MAQRYHIFLDGTLESQAPFFAQKPMFQTWLRSYNNVPEALQFISQITLPYSTLVYVARDNILDDGIPLDTNGQTRTLLDTLCDLRTIQHVSVLFPTIDTDLEVGIRSTLADKRLLRDVVSVINLHSYICKQGMQYLEEEIARCIHKREIHLIPNLTQNLDELMEYLGTVMNDRRQITETMEEEHSNRLGQEPL